MFVMGSVAKQNQDVAQLYQSRTRSMQVVALAENIEQYFNETMAFPANVAALTGTSGFEHARGAVDVWQGYAVSPTITDSVWQFSRAVLFSNDPSSGTSIATYLASNACGAGGYDTAVSWCGSNTGKWFRRETRERYAEQISAQRVRLKRLLEKFSDYYNTNGNFPDKDSGNNPLAANSMNTIKVLAGYGGTAKTCSGTYTYMGVPIDCGDMYDLWGGPVGYQFVSSKQVVFVSETPIYNNSGTKLIVALNNGDILW